MNTVAARILESLHSQKPVDGFTHNFYRYPARFSPELAREIILQFSGSNDWLVDPFMGGGTAIVEALASGRSALGIDVNSLAHFVSTAKTTPLSSQDQTVLRDWASQILPSSDASIYREKLPPVEATRNLPTHMMRFLSDALVSILSLEHARQQRFARCAVLRTCQAVLDCRDSIPHRREIGQRLFDEVNRMLTGLDDFVQACRLDSLPKNKITSRRILISRSTIGVEADKMVLPIRGRPRLVFTSPPYPGVHVLYHRWQIRGRKETPIPYWICGLKDGKTSAHYTFGSRSATGRRQYFEMLVSAFASISRIVHREAIIIQLVGFSEIESQLPAYLAAMRQAGYKEVFPLTRNGERLWREVPNRRWYARDQHNWDAAREVLMFYCLARRG